LLILRTFETSIALSNGVTADAAVVEGLLGRVIYHLIQ
jgi:hypothetical protein